MLSGEHANGNLFGRGGTACLRGHEQVSVVGVTSASLALTWQFS